MLWEMWRLAMSGDCVESDKANARWKKTHSSSRQGLCQMLLSAMLPLASSNNSNNKH